MTNRSYSTVYGREQWCDAHDSAAPCPGVTVLNYYLIFDPRDDTYVAGLDSSGPLWCDSGEEPRAFDSLRAVEQFGREAWGREDGELPDPLVVKVVQPPALGSIVKVTSTATWCGYPLVGQLGRVVAVSVDNGAVLLTVKRFRGWYREGDPSFDGEVYLWAHEIVPGQLPPVGQAVA